LVSHQPVYYKHILGLVSHQPVYYKMFVINRLMRYQP
jgi:hypothetical protein